MLDADRNLACFPEDFMFQLSAEETLKLKSQNATSSWGGRRRSLPYAFTEHGVAMLSTVLKSEQAAQMSFIIVRAFVRMQELIISSKEIAARVEKLEWG